MRSKLPWLLTTLALIVAAVAVTLVVTRKHDQPPRTLTVKQTVNCQTENGQTPSADCVKRVLEQERKACSPPEVAAVELTVAYANGASAGPTTVVCSTLSSSASGP